MFYNYNSEKYLNILKREEESGEPLEKIEREEYGTDHKEVGAAILEQWNFPQQYSDTALEHESLNITSPYKNLILTVTIGDLLAGKLGFGPFTSGKEELYRKILPYTCLKSSDAEYYENNFFDELKKDPLFHDCQALFGI